MIYAYYFATQTYIIHDIKYRSDNGASSNAMIPFYSCSSSVHHFYDRELTPSRRYCSSLNTGKESHISLFLIHPLIMPNAHPIFLAGSTFTFVPCILSNQAPSRWGRPPHFVSADHRPELIHRIRASQLSKLINLNIPKQWLCGMRQIECERDTAWRTMNVLEFIGRWTRRCELSNFVRKKDQDSGRERNNGGAKGKPRKITLLLRGLGIFEAQMILREEQSEERCLDVSLEHVG